MSSLLLSAALIARENPFLPVAHPGRVLFAPDLRPVTAADIPKQNGNVTIDIVRMPKPPAALKPPEEAPAPRPKTIMLKPESTAPSVTKTEAPSKKAAPKPRKKEPSPVKKRHKVHYRTLYHNRYITLKTAGDRLLCLTRNRLVRHRILAHPQRLVLDFRGENAFPSREKMINTPYACYLWAGSHIGFYRIVIKMRPDRSPKITQKRESCLIKFRRRY